MTELTKNKNINPDTLARMARYYSERQICEIVWLVASEHLYDMTNIGLNIQDMLCDVVRKKSSDSRRSHFSVRDSFPDCKLGLIDVHPAFSSRCIRARPFGKLEKKAMQLGFIGTGEITASIVTGLRSLGATPDTIQLSPRNPAIAHKLANRFKGICIASCNQEVLDHSDMIVIAVRPPAARSVLSELRFHPDHQVISLVAGLSLRSLSELVAPATRITRAVPLPSSAKGLSPTAVYPPDRAAYDLFTAVGTVFEVESEKEFDAMCATTATIASYLAFIERVASWLAQQGVPESKAREYLARMFLGVTTTAVDPAQRSFQSLAANHATAGGINEQFLKHLVEHGLLTSVSEALDAILQRISTESPRPNVGATVSHQ